MIESTQNKKSQTNLEKKYIKTSVLMAILMSLNIVIWILGVIAISSLIQSLSSFVCIVGGAVLMFITELWIFFFFMKVLDNLENKLKEIQSLGSDKE